MANNHINLFKKIMLIGFTLNKKFLKTDYPQGKAIEVFRRFHFGLLEPKTEILYFTSPRTAENDSSDLSEGEVNRKPRGRSHRGII